MNVVALVAARPHAQAMRNPYQMTSNADAMRQLFRVTSEALPNLASYAEPYPDEDTPVIRDIGGRSVTNVRNLLSPHLRTALSKLERRCVMPVTTFNKFNVRA